MKKLLYLVIIFFTLPQIAAAQKITYSEHRTEENAEINFEIIGKQGNNYIVYKNIRWKHLLSVYDDQMKLISNDRMKFIPDKTFNVDFITYPEYFYMIYQYQKNNTVYCKAVKLNNDGIALSEPIHLDTSRIGAFAERRIYTTTFSEDRKHILVYKMMRKNDQLTLVTKLYDKDLALADSSRQLLKYNERVDIYGDINVANSGTYIFAKETKKGFRDNVWKLEMLIKTYKADTLTKIQVPLRDKFIDEVMIKIDNRNNNYIINSLYCSELKGDIEGLFTTLMKQENPGELLSAFNPFPDSVRTRVNASGLYRAAFNNMYLRNVVVTRDGGFILTTEDFYSTTTGNYNRSRYDYLYNSPYSTINDYYLYSPSYYGFYRPMYFRNLQTVRYYYDNILVLSLDSSLRIQWDVILHKKQADAETDNFLSFATMVSGGELHYLFMETDKRNQVIMNNGITPNGKVTRYPTLKGNDSGYRFMPKLAKQVGVNQMIIPCLYRGYIAFAKVEFL